MISNPQVCIKFKEFASLTSQRKTRVRETGFYCPSNRDCRCVMKVYRCYFQGRTKYRWATCMFMLPNVAQQNCLSLNKRNIFSWPWTEYSNTYVSRSYLETICWRQNHLRKWSSKRQSQWQLLPASHDLRGPGKRVVLEPSLHFTSGLQSLVCILSPVCSPQSLYFEKNKSFKGKAYTFTKKYCFKSGEIWVSSLLNKELHKITLQSSNRASYHGIKDLGNYQNE